MHELPHARPGNSPKSILVVEDDQVVRMLTVEVLEELGYRVFEAEDAPQALAILERDQPLDLLMTDISLPGISGRQLMTLARRLRPQLPVLFASGYAEADYPDEGPHGEVAASSVQVASLSKPFSLESLRTTVQRLLEQS